jgi:uncharacterized protein (DUF4415 family)
MKVASSSKSRLPGFGNPSKSDAEIDTSDVPELDKDFFRPAQVRMLKARQMVSLRLDCDVLD